MNPAKKYSSIFLGSVYLCVVIALGHGDVRAQTTNDEPTLDQTINFIIEYGNSVASNSTMGYTFNLDTRGNVAVFRRNVDTETSTASFNDSFHVSNTNISYALDKFLAFHCIDVNCITNQRLGLGGRSAPSREKALVLLTPNDKLYKAFLHYQKLTGGKRKSLF